MKNFIKYIGVVSVCLLLVIMLPVLVLAEGPPNDNFADAEEIFGVSGTVTGSNEGADTEVGEPTHGSSPYNFGDSCSVWWKWTSPVNGTATFNINGSSIHYGIILAVYTGSSVSELNYVADAFIQVQPDAVFSVTRGTTYYITVAGCSFWKENYDTVIEGDIVLNWNVEMLTPEVYEWPDSATAIIYGDPLSASTLSGGSASVPGAFEFVDPNYVPPAAGTCSAGVKFVPADQDTYDIVTGGIVTVPVNRAPLTITAENKSKIYGDPDPVFTASYDGFKLGDTPAAVSGLTFSREPGEDVGEYTITPSGATASNYDISYASGTLTIEPAPLTITADDKSKTYGDDDPVFTASYSGFKRGDTAAVVSGLTFSREAGEDVGEYTITPSGATASNYTITFASGTLTISPAPLTIKADDKSKTYGDDDPAFTVSYSGFKRGETAAVVSGLVISRAEGEDAGQYAIIPSGATASNYTITFESGTLTINPAPLTIKADDKSKVYGDADPAFTVSYSGFKLGDTAAVVSGLTFNREEGENVGQYAITPSGATAGNYIITFVDGTLTINPAPLTITADDKSKTYGDDDPALTVSYDGFKRGDTAAVVSGLNISREAGENVGQYAITPSGATASNYTITFVDGTLTINPAPLTITADDKSKTYGDDDPAFTVSYEGFRRGDTASVVSGLNISREAGENVGQYAITPSGATAGNYTITFVDGTLTINPAPLTITADDKSKVYGDPDPAFTASYDGFKLGDTAGVVSGLAFSREEGEDVGTYTITPYGATASNYAITFESGTLTINKATPLVTAWPQAAPIIYGDMLGSSSLTGGEASVPGSFAFVYPEACPEAGLQSVAVTFIPEDTHNYNSVSGTVEIAVKYMLSINPDTGGSVSGAGEYLPGEEVQIKAEPAVGYRFVCWMEGGAIIGDDAEMSITLSDHRILRAVFWEYDTEKTWSQKDIGTTDNKATVDFHDGKVSMEINSPGEITDGQIDVTLYDADAEKGAPEGMVPAGIYLRIERTDNFAGSTVRLVVKYDPAELPEDVEETSLKLYRFVPGTGWVEVSPQGVNKAEKYIWAELTGFSTFAVFGEVSPSEDLPKTEGTQVYLAVLAALFAIGGLFALLRRKLAKEN